MMRRSRWLALSGAVLLPVALLWPLLCLWRDGYEDYRKLRSFLPSFPEVHNHVTERPLGFHPGSRGSTASMDSCFS